MKGDGNGGFTQLSLLQSGIYIPGNGKALVKLSGSSGRYLIASSEHLDSLKVFALNGKKKVIKLNPWDVSALIQFKNGQISKEEFYYGSSFLSQSSRFLSIDDNVSSVQITDSKGQTRKISL